MMKELEVCDENGKDLRKALVIENRRDISKRMQELYGNNEIPIVLFVRTLVFRKYIRFFSSFIELVELCCPENNIISVFDETNGWTPIDDKRIAVFLNKTQAETSRLLKIYSDLFMLAKFEMAGMVAYIINPNVAIKGLAINTLVTTLFPKATRKTLEHKLAVSNITELMRAEKVGKQKRTKKNS